LSATGSNGNENTAGSDPGEPQAHRVRGAASGWEAAPGVWRPQPSGSAGDDAVLDALLRARRDGSAPASASASGVFALDAGPEPEPDDVPLRSRGGGQTKPRAAVPTALLAEEAVRLVDVAHTKRARMVTAFGVPAVFLAATGVAVMPTVANAASSSSNSATQTAANCAAGSKTVANPAAKAGATAPSSSAPSSAPSSSGSSKAGSLNLPGVPLPTSAPSTAQGSAPSARPSSSPSGTTTPAKAAPTTAPTAPAPTSKSTAPAAPSSTPSPSSSATWWNPLSWLGTTVNGVFNPAPTSSSSNSTVNKLSTTPAAAPAATSSSSPAPILSIGLGGSSSSPSTPPSSGPTSKPSVPSTPQPSSSGSSAPSKAPSSSAPSTNPSGPVVVNGTTLPAAPATVCVAAADPGALREVEWHLDASSLTLIHQRFDGFHDIQTGDGKTVTVMFVHADQIQLTDMVTYNEDGKTRIYSDGGKGKTVTLTNVELHVLQQKGSVVAPLPLGPVTLGPPGEAGTDLGSTLAMLALESNIDLGPTIMSDVHVDQYTMTSDTLNIPHFNVGLTNSTPGY